MNKNQLKLKISPIEIDPKKPFNGDQLERSENGEILTQFIKNTERPLVLSINSPWGTGKTTFIKMWKQMLLNEGVPSIYFNAWENDLSHDPLISLIGEIDIFRESINEKDRTEKLYKQTLESGIKLVDASLPLIVRSLSTGLLSLEDLRSDTLSSFMRSQVSKMVSDHKNNKLLIGKFKSSLTNLINKLSDRKTLNPDYPLVFIIDELDRCRPDYSINLLEVAKHLFSVENIVFVLAIDRQQLNSYVKAMFGEFTAVDGYLRRFIDIDYNLPKPRQGKYVACLWNKFKLEEYIEENVDPPYQGDVKIVFRIFSELFYLFDFSLRKQEHCFSHFNIALKTSAGGIDLHPVLLSTLIALRFEDPTLYDGYINKTVSVEKIFEHILSKRSGKEFIYKELADLIYVKLLCGRENKQEYESVKKSYNELLTDENKPKNDRERAERILLRLQNEDKYIGSYVNQVIKKIEIADKFQTL